MRPVSRDMRPVSCDMRHMRPVSRLLDQTPQDACFVLRSLLQARIHARAHTHVQDAGVDLVTYDIKTILVDPPRAGEESADSRARSSIRIIFLLAALSPCIPFGQRPPSACMPLCCALWSAERVVCILQDSTPVRWN